SELHQRLKTTMIYVTHDQVEAMTMADKIVVLRAGNIEQVGSPLELYLHPRNTFVAGFIGSPKMNLFEGEVAKSMGCATYGIRPEHLELSSEEGLWAGTVRHVERLGADTFVYLDVPTLGLLVSRTSGERSFRPGETLMASPMPGKAFLYGAV
ncbi:MAG: sugar ABC transporter ATP-binding protein, partial [Acidobacteria bacterium]|nr:sugar ABC transporter ATP-binding protein [Acidobacteriota bacterium]